MSTSFQENQSFQYDGYPTASKVAPKTTVSVTNLQEYETARADFSFVQFDVLQLDLKQLQQHNISFAPSLEKLKNNDFSSSKNHFPQIFFSILHSQFYGLQYLYQVLLGPFKLKIHILNLLRQSDAGDDDLNTQQVGAGSFGTVTEVKLNSKSYATKRIPFHYKIQPQEDYDYEQNKAQQLHLRRCLKQFCFYKICSLLKIGPKIINAGYDLICFNNCIQFKMQLCEPITNEFKYETKGVTIEQCSYNLYEKMFLMHSFKMVHRDIKPQNILFSHESKEFVFGDFGMAMLLKEDYTEQTQTRFAGTPNFCGQEMKKLLDGGSGKVNLYLNDIHSLKLTLAFFTSNIVGQNSQISSNSMSYDNYETSFFGSSSFQAAQSIQNSSQAAVVTDRSQTRNSLATQSTMNTLAPKRYSSLINYFQGQIIYAICREMERCVDIPYEVLAKHINRYQEEHKNKEIEINLYNEIVGLFVFVEESQQVQLSLREWRNSSRHYGPQHELTLLRLQNINFQGDLNYMKRLDSIKKTLKNVKRKDRIVDQLQMETYLQLKNWRSYLFSFLSFIRNCLREDRKQTDAQKTSDAIVVAEHYILVLYTFLSGSNQASILLKLIFKYFNLSPKHDSINAQDLLFFCYEMFNTFGYASIPLTIKYLTILTSDTLFDNWGYKEKYIKQKIKKLIIQSSQFSNEDKVSLQLLLKKLCQYNLEAYPNFLQREQLLQARLKLVTELEASATDSLSVCFLCSIVTKVQILYDLSSNEKALELALETQKCLTDDLLLKDQLYIHCKVSLTTSIGAILGRLKRYSQAINVTKKGLKILSEHSKTLIWDHITANILANIYALYFDDCKFEKAIESLQDYVSFFKKIDFPKKAQHLCLCYQDILQLYFTTKKYEQNKQKMIGFVQELIAQIYNYCSASAYWKNVLVGSFPLLNRPKITLVNSETLFLHQAVISTFRSKKDYLNLFRSQCSWTYYELGRYYVQKARLQLKGSQYIWQCLRHKLEYSHPKDFTLTDLGIVYIYAQLLVKNNANRFAIRFLNHFIKHIPEQFLEIKINALELIHKAMQIVGDKNRKLYSELTKNDCNIIKDKDFRLLVRILSSNPKQQKLNEKLIKKLFFVEL